MSVGEKGIDLFLEEDEEGTNEVVVAFDGQMGERVEQ